MKMLRKRSKQNILLLFKHTSVSFIKNINLRLNLKPYSIISLQKNLYPNSQIETFYSLLQAKNNFFRIKICFSQELMPLLILTDHNDLYNVDNNAFLFSKNLKKMKHKPHSSISNNFSYVFFGLVIWVINYWSNFFVWWDWIDFSIIIINYHHKVPPDKRIFLNKNRKDCYKMKENKSLKTAQELALIFNKNNIISVTNCMTRLRITVKAGTNIDEAKIRLIENVIGLVVNDNEFQIILGPGFVNQVTTDFKKFFNLKTDLNENINIQSKQSLAAIATFEKQKLRTGGKIKKFLTKISKVFTPLIPAFIGAGLLSGIAGIILSSARGSNGALETIKSWNSILAFALAILTNVFIIAVGWRLGEEFGGNAGLCALIAAMFCGFASTSIAGVFIPINNGEAYNFLGIIINKNNIQHNWLTVGFVNLDSKGNALLGAPHAGLVGAMIATGVTIFVEKQFRKFMPGAIDTIVTPILVIITIIFLNFVFIIPAAGYLFTAITWLFNNLYTNPLGAALLAGVFLFALMFGVHQGFLPIYFALIADKGVNVLFPIMCMAGAAQIGCAIAMWFMAGKGSLLRKQISGAIIPAFLGIGEPIMYGISLPRVKPFFVSCIGGAIGGFIMSALSTWGNLEIGMNAPTGAGGLTAAIMMTTVDGNAVKGILVYLAVLFIVYFIGAGLCFFAYSRVARYGSKKITKLSIEWLTIIKSKDQSFENKIFSSLKQFGLIIVCITIIGLPIIWLIWYFKLNNEEKINLKQFQLV